MTVERAYPRSLRFFQHGEFRLYPWREVEQNLEYIAALERDIGTLRASLNAEGRKKTVWKKRYDSTAAELAKLQSSVESIPNGADIADLAESVRKLTKSNDAKMKQILRLRRELDGDPRPVD